MGGVARSDSFIPVLIRPGETRKIFPKIFPSRRRSFNEQPVRGRPPVFWVWRRGRLQSPPTPELVQQAVAQPKTPEVHHWISGVFSYANGTNRRLQPSRSAPSAPGHTAPLETTLCDQARAARYPRPGHRTRRPSNRRRSRRRRAPGRCALAPFRRAAPAR